MNLTNQVHPIFQDNAFRGLNALEYAEILPAVTLASRFIDEDEYMDFFAHLSAGIMAKDTRPPNKKFQKTSERKNDVINPDPTNNLNVAANLAAARTQIRAEFAAMSNHLRFFSLNERATAALDPVFQAAESFTDADHANHRFYLDTDPAGCPPNPPPNHCRKCLGLEMNRCYSCGGHFYHNATVAELRQPLELR
jgi:hypothetical protein